MTESQDGHTLKRYDAELQHLRESVLAMGDRVLVQVQASLAAFRDRDRAGAAAVVAADAEIDDLEQRLDTEVANLLARRAPLGGDLRLLMAASKIVSDLERIGDEAVRIAAVTMDWLDKDGASPDLPLSAFNRMGEMATGSLRRALDRFAAWDGAGSDSAVPRDPEMDQAFGLALRLLVTYIMEDSRNIGFAIEMALVIKAMERIGHQAHNIAEYTWFQQGRGDLPPA